METIVKPIYSVEVEPNLWVTHKNENYSIKLETQENTLVLEAKRLTEQDTHTFVYYQEVSPINNITPSAFQVDTSYTYTASMKGEKTGSLNVQLVVIAFEKDRAVHTEYLGLDMEKNLYLPSKTTAIKFAIRVQGEGTALLNEITLKSFTNSLEELDHFTAKKNEAADYLLVTNVYPEKNNLYRNMFVHRRAELYELKGLKLDVFRFNSRERSLGNYTFENIFTLTGGKKQLSELLQHKKYKKILIHFVNQEMMEAIEESMVQIPIIVWIHGVETEKWYRRWFNFSGNSKELEAALKSIEKNKKTVNFMKSIYESKTLDIKFVFVSQWFKEAIAESDTNAVVERYEIIHNVVDEELFSYVEKRPEQRKKILSIRPYASRKYANDLTVKAILELSTKPFFSQLEFNLYGQGSLFHETLEPIKHFENVHLHHYFLSQREIAEIHKQHGIFLCPTRLDSQGVSMCEAMASGLVPITSGVTAIPEFVDKECGYLAAKEDHLGLASAIEELYHNPDLFSRKSANAAFRMKVQCGKEKIIKQEMSVITS